MIKPSLHSTKHKVGWYAMCAVTMPAVVPWIGCSSYATVEVLHVSDGQVAYQTDRARFLGVLNDEGGCWFIIEPERHFTMGYEPFPVLWRFVSIVGFISDNPEGEHECALMLGAHGGGRVIGHCQVQAVAIREIAGQEWLVLEATEAGAECRIRVRGAVPSERLSSQSRQRVADALSNQQAREADGPG